MPIIEDVRRRPPRRSEITPDAPAPAPSRRRAGWLWLAALAAACAIGARAGVWPSEPLHRTLSFLLVYASLNLSGAIALLAIKTLYAKTHKSAPTLLLLLAFTLAATGLSLQYAFLPALATTCFGATALLLVMAKHLFRNHTYEGLNFYLANIMTVIAGVSWGTWFMLAIHVSLFTRLLLMAGAPLLLIAIPSDLVQLLETYDVLCRLNWFRPKRPRLSRRSIEPMVSIHVPTYSEPPEVVIETLNHLSRLLYYNYEVIVVDNNTTDPTLWRPVLEHCVRLGSKFRFIHVENLPGAKGGALNYALKHTNPRAELVAVVDADYHADPNFLRALVGHFDDPKVGFVQTPHDYRGWKGNLYLTMCYWEYKIFFYTTMVTLNERGAGLTVGTMCVIRRQALLDAGLWSTWCVTEDSELAIRIHDAGYSSVYVSQAFGCGLIPETFLAFKKQRFRWTAGPVQEFRFHAKHISGLSRRPSAFNFWQRVHHLNHGLDNIMLGFDIPLRVVGLAAIASMVWHHEIVPVPFELWLVATVTLFSTPVLNWLMYRAVLGVGFKQILSQMITSKALNHVVTFAAFRTLITGNAAWTRTNKFRVRHSYLSALAATRTEITLAIGLIAFIGIAYADQPSPGLSLMFLIGACYSAAAYLTAPLVSLINASSMRLAAKRGGTTLVAAPLPASI